MIIILKIAPVTHTAGLCKIKFCCDNMQGSNGIEFKYNLNLLEDNLVLTSSNCPTNTMSGQKSFREHAISPVFLAIGFS